MTPTLVFDIETIPDAKGLRKLHDLDGAATDVAVAEFAMQRRRQATGGDFLPLQQHRVLVISCLLRTDEGVRITVQDSGPGIPEDHLSRVFDRFYKVDLSRTGTAVPSGSGLGLSIVQAIVRRHGGRIEADNAPGGGARFTIMIPGIIYSSDE